MQERDVVKLAARVLEICPSSCDADMAERSLAAPALAREVIASREPGRYYRQVLPTKAEVAAHIAAHRLCDDVDAANWMILDGCVRVLAVSLLDDGRVLACESAEFVYDDPLCNAYPLEEVVATHCRPCTPDGDPVPWQEVSDA